MPVKKSLRDDVREYLMQRMRQGKLVAGESVNLAALARTLGVSVTPVREALTQLQRSQVIEAIPNRGFFIKALSHGEARNLYELVAQLEVLALEKSVFDATAIAGLREQHKAVQRATDALDRVNAYMEFHRLLTNNYANAVAQQILADLKTRVFLYERTFMSDVSFHYNSDDQHEAIISAIEDDNVPSAVLVLKMNWHLIQDYIAKRLKAS